MIRRPPRSTQSRSSAASDVYKRQDKDLMAHDERLKAEFSAQPEGERGWITNKNWVIATPMETGIAPRARAIRLLSLIHISEPTRLGMISYAVFCLKKKNK